MHKNMSEDAPSLESELLRWAKGHNGDAADWLSELHKEKIRDLQTLEERSESSRWQNTLNKLSNGLVAKLEKWFTEKYPESNFSSHN